MTSLNRRNLLTTGVALAMPVGLMPRSTGQKESEPTQLGYLEIVTPEVDALCTHYAAVFGVEFSDPKPNLGNARTAAMKGGGTLGIRGPLRDSETPVVRPYWLVDDIKASVSAMAEEGAEVALGPMPLPGHGTCAIVIHGGIECGLWQNE